jgi:hypothetical protein
MPNILSYEVTANSGKAKEEILSLLRETKTEASQTARSLNDLRTASINHAQATADQARKVKDLQTNLSRTNEQYKETREQIKFHTAELKSEERALNQLYQKLGEVKAAQAAMAGTGASSSYAKELKLQEQALVGALDDTTAKYNERAAALRTLTTREESEITAKKLLIQGLINEKQILHDLTATQQLSNREKARASQTNQELEKRIRQLTAEMKQLERQERAVQKETHDLSAANIAMANVLGNAVYNAFSRVFSIGADFIKQATIYSSRTDEMKIAMLGMADASGNFRGELLRQEEGIKRLNITTQEARETLSKFQLAQLDVSKASALARAAQDLAIVAGAETGEELNRLVHGITTLQTRVLRTAGVNITLIESYKKVAAASGRSVASFSAEEKQAIALNAVLDYASRATDLYGLSLDNAGKRMRSMTRLYQELMNSVGGLMQGPFGNLVDTLSGLLTLGAKAPKVFGAILLVLASFVFQVTKTALATSHWGQQLLLIGPALANATKQTLGFSSAVVTSETTMKTAALTGERNLRGAMSSIGSTVAKTALLIIGFNTALAASAEIAKAYGGTTKFDADDLEKVTQQDLDAEIAKLKELTKQREAYQRAGDLDKYGRAKGFASRLANVVTELPILSAIGSIEDVARAEKTVAENVDLMTAKLGLNKTVVDQVTVAQRAYDEELEKANRVNLDFTGTIEVLTGDLQMFKLNMEALKQPLNAATGFTLDWSDSINVLGPQLLGIDDAVKKSSPNFEAYAQKWQMIATAADVPMDLIIQMLTTLRTQSNKTFGGFGSDAERLARRLEDVRLRLVGMTREVNELLAGTGEAGSLELQEKRLQIVRQEIDAVNAARINLNRDVGQPIPADRESRLSLKDTYETSIKVRDEIRAAARANKDFIAEVVKAQQLASTARTDAISAELAAAKMIADNQVKRIQDERQLTAEIIALSKDREERAKDEAGARRRAFGSFYKEQLEELIKIEDSSRRLQAMAGFSEGATIGGLDIPVYNKIETALENIAIPTATEAENIATIATEIQEINNKIPSIAGATTPSGPRIDTSTFMGALLGGASLGTILQSKPGTGPTAFFGAGATGILGSRGGLGSVFDQRNVYDVFGKKNVATTTPMPAGGNINLVKQLLMGAGFGSSISVVGQGSTHNKWGLDHRGSIDVSTDPGTAEGRRLESLLRANKIPFTPLYGAKQGVSTGPHYHIGAPSSRTGQAFPVGTTGNIGMKAAAGAGIVTASTQQFEAFSKKGTTRANAITLEEMLSGSQAALTSDRDARKRLSKPNILDSIAYYKKLKELEQNDFDTRAQNMTELNVLDAQWNAKYFDGAQHRQAVTSASELQRKKAFLSTHDTLIALIDEESKRASEATRRRQSETEAAEIRARTAFNASRDGLQAALDDKATREQNHGRYMQTIYNNTEEARVRASEESIRKLDELRAEEDSGWRQSLDFRLTQWRNFEAARIAETRRTEDRLAELDYLISHAKDLDPLKTEIARKEAILDEARADGEAKASMAANAERLANSQIYHADRANAKIMDYLARQRSVDEIVADSRISTMETIFGAIDTGLARITNKLGAFGDIVKEIISGFARLALSKVFMALFGLNPISRSGGGSGGGILSNIFGGVGNIFGGGGGNVGGTPPFAGGTVQGILGMMSSGGGNTNPTSAAANALKNIFGIGSNNGFAGSTGIQASLPELAPRVGGGGGWADFAKKLGIPTGKLGGGGLLAGLAPMLPMLGLTTGLGLGIGAGGQSGLGRILGGIGGLGIGGALGAAAFTALGGTMSASLAGFMAIAGPAALIAGPLLIAGAMILGRNKKRRENEKIRTQYMNDSLGALNELLKQVRRDKIGVDEALAQAVTIRSQYLSNAQSITDKKTRNIALKDVSRLDVIIEQIKAAGVGQSRRREMDKQLVPEFAGGAFIVPGVDVGYDSIAAMLRPGEMVLNKQQQAAVGYEHLSRARVPNYVPTGQYAGGGFATVPSTRMSSSAGEMNIYLVTDRKYAEKLAVQGRDKIIQLVSNDIRDEGKVLGSLRGIKK